MTSLRRVTAGLLVYWLAAGGLAACADSEEPAPVESVHPTDATIRDLAAKPSRLFGSPPRNPFRRDMSQAPVSPESSAIMRNLTSQLAENGGIAPINTSAFTASLVVAEPATSRVRVGFDNCQHKASKPPNLHEGAGHFLGVPIPSEAQPAKGTDGLLTIWSPSTDQLWEFWRVGRNQSGEWTACWGGRMDHVSTSDGAFPEPYGASASGLATVASAISIEEAREGRIEHVLGLGVKRIADADQTVYPANRSDGKDPSNAAIPMGTRFRLDPDVDVESLPMTPLGKAVARAAQRYGFMVTETSGVVGVGVEGGMREKQQTGQNPWQSILGGVPDYFQLKGFPWSRVKAIQDTLGSVPPTS